MPEARPTEQITRLERALDDARTGEREARHLAEATQRARDAFLSKLSHDLRNPLGAIAAATEVLGRIGGQGPDETRARDVIRRQVQQLTRIVDDLLDVSRVLHGTIVLSPAPLDLATVVRRTVDVMAASGRLSEHQIEHDLASAWINADSPRIEQVATHLLANAARFSPAGSTIRVRVTPGDMATLVVADAGIGIAPAQLVRVFEPFVLDEHEPGGRRKGFGVGLALVKRLVELHGGTVQATSDGADRGSRFEIRLPGIDAPPAS